MHNRSTIAAAALAGLAAIAFSQGGCSFVTNETAIQCTSERECLSLGPAFANTTCDVETKTCKKLPSPVECVKNVDCGADALCRDTRCVQVGSKECPIEAVRGRQFLADDNALVVGTLTPFESGNELGDAIEKGAYFAQQEISPTSTGTGIATAGGGTRPLVLVSCKEFNNDGLQGLRAAAEHLVKDLKVPVVIGPTDPSNAEIVARNVTLPNQVLNIATGAITSSLDALNPAGQAPLLWRVNFSDTNLVKTLTPFMNQWLRPRLEADGMIAPGQDIRVAIIAEGDYKGLELARVVRENFAWNGTPTTPLLCAQQAAGACTSLDFGSLNDVVGNPTPDGKISAVLGPVFLRKDLDAPPHVVLHSYAVFGIPRIIFPIEGGWEANYNAGTGYPNGRDDKRPYHIGLFPPFNTFTPLFGFMDLQSQTPHPPGYIDTAKRFFAFYAHQEDYLSENAGVKIDEFARLYKEKFPEFTSDTPKDVLVRLIYDAVYMTVYATAALGDLPATGPNIASKLPRLLSGTPYLTGTADQKAIYTAMTSGQSVNLQGLSGSLDLDQVTGGTHYDVEVSCTGKKADGSATNFVPSGFYFNGEQGRLVGLDSPQKTCPWLKP